jgi:hypothetical protein
MSMYWRTIVNPCPTWRATAPLALTSRNASRKRGRSVGCAARVSSPRAMAQRSSLVPIPRPRTVGCVSPSRKTRRARLARNRSWTIAHPATLPSGSTSPSVFVAAGARGSVSSRSTSSRVRTSCPPSSTRAASIARSRASASAGDNGRQVAPGRGESVGTGTAPGRGESLRRGGAMRRFSCIPCVAERPGRRAAWPQGRRADGAGAVAPPAGLPAGLGGPDPHPRILRP